MYHKKVTKSIAKKMGLEEGVIIEYDRLLRDDEMHPLNAGLRCAANVFYKGIRIGGTLHLDESDDNS